MKSNEMKMKIIILSLFVTPIVNYDVLTIYFFYFTDEFDTSRVLIILFDTKKDKTC